MKKESIIIECNELFKKIKDPSHESYGTGEFMESLIEDLVPYLNKEGLLYLKSMLESLWESQN